MSSSLGKPKDIPEREPGISGKESCVQTLSTVEGSRQSTSVILALYTPEHENRRQDLLAKMGDQKRNVLAEGYTPEEMQELEDLTRRKCLSMKAIQVARKRFHMTLEETFGKDQSLAQEFRDLGDDVMGKYLNTNQYHNAEHIFTMARDVLELAHIAEIDDAQTKQELLTMVLYHDAGNGLRPGDPAGSDETAAVKIFMQDWKKATGEHSPHSLRALRRIEQKRVQNIAAGIAATVFRDRFAVPKLSSPNGDYIRDIVKLLPEYEHVDESMIDQRVYLKFCRLMEGTEAWLMRSADIMGSLLELNSTKNNLTNRMEDWERDLKETLFRVNGPRGYFKGFINFLSAAWEPKKEKEEDVPEEVKIAQSGSPLWTPKGNKADIVEYGKKLLNESKVRMDKIFGKHLEIMTLLYFMIDQQGRAGKRLTDMPLAEIREMMLGYLQEPDLFAHIKAVMKNATLESITFTEQSLRHDYPLLFAPHLEKLTIPDLTSGMVNRIFTPAAARYTTQEEINRVMYLSNIAERQSDIDYHAAFAPDEALEQRLGLAVEVLGVESLTPSQTEAIITAMRIGSDTNTKNHTFQKAAQQWNVLRESGMDIQDVRDLSDADIINIWHLPSSKESEDIADDFLAFAEEHRNPTLQTMADFADLTPDLLWKEIVPAGKKIIEIGTNPQRICIIGKGKVRVMLEPPKKPIDVGPGELLGEISALQYGRAVADVIALEETELFSMPAFELSDYAHSNLRLVAKTIMQNRNGKVVKRSA